MLAPQIGIGLGEFGSSRIALGARCGQLRRVARLGDGQVALGCGELSFGQRQRRDSAVPGDDKFLIDEFD